ncbi:MAG: hypothetical protein SGPRY_005669, partial [Prymnesium sp.]
APAQRPSPPERVPRAEPSPAGRRSRPSEQEKRGGPSVSDRKSRLASSETHGKSSPSETRHRLAEPEGRAKKLSSEAPHRPVRKVSQAGSASSLQQLDETLPGDDERPVTMALFKRMVRRVDSLEFASRLSKHHDDSLRTVLMRLKSLERGAASSHSPSAECKAPNPERRRGGGFGPFGFTSVIVTSSGGVGTSLLIHTLRLLNVTTNDHTDRDGLKHMRPGSLRFLPSKFGKRPLVVFVYTDPVRALIALGSKHWLNDQAMKLGSPVNQDGEEYDAAEPPCVAAARREHIQKEAGILHDLPRGCALSNPDEEPPPPSRSSETAKMCKRAYALKSLTPLASYDWVGISRHWGDWVDASCLDGLTANDSIKVPVLFLRSDQIHRSYVKLAMLLGLDRKCMPQALCKAPRLNSLISYNHVFSPSINWTMRMSRTTLIKLNRTYRSMRHQQDTLPNFFVAGPKKAKSYWQRIAAPSYLQPTSCPPKLLHLREMQPLWKRQRSVNEI